MPDPAGAPPAPAVLVVEDDRAFGALLVDLLSGEGWQVRLAADGPSALAWLRAQRFQVVLTDLVIPGADGWMVARAARSHDPDCRVIVMSGAMGPDDVDAGAPPVDAFLAKPVALDRLLAALGAARSESGCG